MSKHLTVRTLSKPAVISLGSVTLTYALFLLLLPRIVPVIVPCLQHLPTQSASFLYQVCNTRYVLDIFITVAILVAVSAVLMIWGTTKRYSLPFWLVPASAACVAIGVVAAYYLYIPIAISKVGAAPIDLYESFREDNTRR